MASTKEIKFKKIYIEITNACNLSCSFCQKLGRPISFISVESFEQVLKQVIPYGKYIYLHVKGEPLFHPYFDQILSICDSYDVYVNLTTNTTLLSKLNRNHKCLRKISLSLTAIDQFNVDIQHYTNNLFNFLEDKQPYPTYIELRLWNIDKLGNNGQQILNNIYNHYHLQANHNINTFTLAKNRFLSFDNEFKWPDNKILSDNTKGFCKGGIDMFAILVNGDVTLCCLDGNGSLVCGNIYKQPLTDIFNSVRFNNIINGFKNNQIIEPTCQSCGYRLRFNKTK